MCIIVKFLKMSNSLSLISPHISNFLSNCVILTLATCADCQPYCANCFYVFDPGNDVLICKSDNQSAHMKQATDNRFVAGTILPNPIDFLAIKGVQFTGVFVLPENDFYKKLYFSKFPIGIDMPGSIWTIRLSEIKMTDNSLGFGTKLKWSRGQ